MPNLNAHADQIAALIDSVLAEPQPPLAAEAPHEHTYWTPIQVELDSATWTINH